MSLKNDYDDAILSELLVEKLKTGTIPTVESLTEELAQLKLENPNLGEKPFFSIVDNSVEFYENSSASKTNDSFERFVKDIAVIWDSIFEIREKIARNDIRWSTYYQTTKRFLDKLEDRIDNLLLVNSDTLGYFNYVSDDFSTTNFSDLETSTALIDTGTGVVTIQNSSGESTDPAKIDLSALQESDLTFAVVEATKFSSSILATGASLLDALSDDDTSWITYVKATTQAAVTASLKIDLKETKTVNKIVYKVAGSTATSSFNITAMYSADGVDYLIVPSDNYTQTTLDYATWVFSDIDARYFKFLITKTGADDADTDTYTFEFGAKNISFYQAGYTIEVDNIFQSTTRQALDNDGNPITFQKAALSVCESVPTGTSIYYYIAIDGGSNFIAIDPLERETPSRSQVIDFSDAVSLENTDSLSVIDSSLDSTKLDFNHVSTYSLVGDTDEILNFYISSSDVANLNQDEITIYRNLGDKERIDETVRGSSLGWSYDSTSNTYTTIIRIDNAEGLNVDFGTSTLLIDGVSSSGVVNLSFGRHEIVVNSVSWADVDSGATTLDELKTFDTLYPYNHKLLIEGYDYDPGFVDEKVYSGADVFAEKLLTYTSVHDFDTQVGSTDTGFYTRDLDIDSNLLFIVKTDKSFADYQNESFLVEYKLANKTFTDIIIKAVLNTTDESLTPVLDGYTIKLG